MLKVLPVLHLMVIEWNVHFTTVDIVFDVFIKLEPYAERHTKVFLEYQQTFCKELKNKIPSVKRCYVLYVTPFCSQQSLFHLSQGISNISEDISYPWNVRAVWAIIAWLLLSSSTPDVSFQKIILLVLISVLNGMTTFECLQLRYLFSCLLEMNFHYGIRQIFCIKTSLLLNDLMNENALILFGTFSFETTDHLIKLNQ